MKIDIFDHIFPGMTARMEKIENYVYDEAQGGVIRSEARTLGKVLDKLETSMK